MPRAYVIYPIDVITKDTNLLHHPTLPLCFALPRLLLPGGDVDIETSQFSRVSKIFYSLALKVFLPPPPPPPPFQE